MSRFVIGHGENVSAESGVRGYPVNGVRVFMANRDLRSEKSPQTGDFG
jgi:hypothetical protein